MIAPLFALAITYHHVKVADVPHTQWTHVTACGVVTLVKKEADGDVHIRLSDGAAFLVVEIIPELPLPAPAKGARVCVSGISRIDKTHGWAEIHPARRIQADRRQR